MEIQKIKKPAGRISPTPMGDYDDTTTYRRLDWVYYGGTSYICKKNNTLGIKPSDPERWQKIIDEIGDMKISFTESETRANIKNGEKLSVIFGKISKCISDIKDIAFTGSYNDLLDAPNSLKNPNAIDIKFNGISQTSYDGSTTSEIDITPANISAINTSALLNTTEQISANTSEDNIVGALAAKAMIADYNSKITQINSNLSEKQVTFTADADAVYGDSTISAKYILLPDRNIILKITGSIHTKSNLSRDDVLGYFNFPFDIEDDNVPAYKDNKSAEDAQPIVIFTFRNGNKLTTRGTISSGSWIGFLGVILAKVK